MGREIKSAAACLIIDDTASDGTIDLSTEFMEGENGLNALIVWCYEQAVEILDNGEKHLGNPRDDRERVTLKLSPKSGGKMNISIDFGEKGCTDGPNSISKQVGALVLERLTDKVLTMRGEDHHGQTAGDNAPE